MSIPKNFEKFNDSEQFNWILKFDLKKLSSNDVIYLFKAVTNKYIIKEFLFPCLNKDLSSKIVIETGLLNKIPENFKTKKICMIAVKKDGNNIWHVPDKLKIEDICLEAVKSMPSAIVSIEKKFQTPKVCLHALKNKGDDKSFPYEGEIYKYVKICENLTLESTIKNLEILVNKESLKNKLKNI